ncbi:MAG: hypothetical protein IJX85_04745 [Lachnospiraceae bacterium]|nr:hypothetical protein [Lachnospiraceae bacterium]
MRYFYEENNGQLNLVCLLEDEQLHPFTYPMIENNQIFGLLKPMYQSNVQGVKRLVYNVTNCMTVKDYLLSYGTEEILSKTYEYIMAIKSSIAAYGISERHFLWNADGMYFNCVTGEIYLICVPLDVCVSYSMPDFKLMANLRECIGQGRVESLYPYTDEGDFDGETTVLCANDSPYVIERKEKPRFKLFSEAAPSPKELRRQRKESRRARKLERKQDKLIKKQITREEGFGFCQIPSLI